MTPVVARRNLPADALRTSNDFRKNDNVISLYDEGDCSQARHAQARYSHLLDFVRGWDGHDSQRISMNTFRFGIQLLQQAAGEHIRVTPQVVPLSYGGIQIEWHSEKADLEIEIERPNRFRVYFYDAKNNQQEEFSGGNDFSDIEDLLARI